MLISSQKRWDDPTKSFYGGCFDLFPTIQIKPHTMGEGLYAFQLSPIVVCGVHKVYEENVYKPITSTSQSTETSRR